LARGKGEPLFKKRFLKSVAHTVDNFMGDDFRALSCKKGFFLLKTGMDVDLLAKSCPCFPGLKPLARVI
jgi:hypothetical protein